MTFTNNADRHTEKEWLEDKSLKALAHDSFHRQCRQLLNYLYESLKALGLNGTGEKLYKRCLGKPTGLEKPMTQKRILREDKYWKILTGGGRRDTIGSQVQCLLGAGTQMMKRKISAIIYNWE